MVGLSARAGALFGDPGPFFVSQAFSLGGVQYGKPLRGYEEFSITPQGYLAERRPVPGATELVRQCVLYQYGRARLSRQPAAVHGRVLRRGQSVGAAEDFDPTRLFRGAGFGASLVTPLGPLGVDLGYGFDRTDASWSQGSQVAGPLQVRSDLLIGVQMRSTFRATTIALILSVVAGVAQAQGGAAPTKVAYVNSQALMDAAPGRAAAESLLAKTGQGFKATAREDAGFGANDARQLPEG